MKITSKTFAKEDRYNQLCYRILLKDQIFVRFSPADSELVKDLAKGAQGFLDTGRLKYVGICYDKDGYPEIILDNFKKDLTQND